MIQPIFLPMFRIKVAKKVSKIHIQVFREVWESQGYDSEQIKDTSEFLEKTLGHPLLQPVRSPHILYHFTTCDHARPRSIVDGTLRPLFVTPYRIDGFPRSQCLFDRSVRWPTSALTLEDFPDPHSYAHNHEPLLLKLTSSFDTLDLITLITDSLL